MQSQVRFNGICSCLLAETQLRCFQRLASQHASERFVKIRRCGCWGYHRSLYLFFHILGKIIPTDLHIFQRGGSTISQYCLVIIQMGCLYRPSWMRTVWQSPAIFCRLTGSKCNPLARISGVRHQKCIFVEIESPN